MSAEQKQALFDNTARAMGDAPLDIKFRHVYNCLKADPAYGEGVAKSLGIAQIERRVSAQPVAPANERRAGRRVAAGTPEMATEA
jgi:catalase